MEAKKFQHSANNENLNENVNLSKNWSPMKKNILLSIFWQHCSSCNQFKKKTLWFLEFYADFNKSEIFGTKVFSSKFQDSQDFEQKFSKMFPLWNVKTLQSKMYQFPFSAEFFLPVDLYAFIYVFEGKFSHSTSKGSSHIIKKTLEKTHTKSNSVSHFFIVVQYNMKFSEL